MRVTGLLVVLLVLGCDRESEPERREDSQPPRASPAPPVVPYLPDDYDPERSGPRASEPAPRAEQPRACPEDMVLVRGSYCVDRYEVSLVEHASSRALSPHYPPTRKYTNQLFARFKKLPGRAHGPLRELLAVPEPPEFQFSLEFEPRAVSRGDTLPAGYLTRTLSERACQNAGKRLCTRAEWVTACRGEQDRKFPYGDVYEEGACNVHRKSHPARLLHGDASRNHLDPRLGLVEDTDGPLLRRTGQTPRCKSTWGDDAIWDMVGNLDEWIEEPSGSFVGGFYSRGTTAGCAASIDSHLPEYFDYSLSTRCCADARR